MTKLLYIILTVHFCSARLFQNPVERENVPYPGVLKHGNKYYAVSSATRGSIEKMPIRESNDLQNWTLVDYVFSKENLPMWADKYSFYNAPEIHMISDDNFRVYFEARNNFGQWVIGVAFAMSIKGPYYPLDKPLLANASLPIQPTIMKTRTGDLYLLWSEYFNGVLYARKLKRDGLSFENVLSYGLLNATSAEDDLIRGQQVLQWDGYYYLFYSGHETCSKGYGIGVARSENPIGPYEKRHAPILTSNKLFYDINMASVIEDKESGKMVLIFNAHETSKSCNDYAMFATYLSWCGKNGWPYISNATEI